jgi:hypothetical protein
MGRSAFAPNDIGHQFIEALSNKDVWAAIRHDFKDASIETLKTVAFRLLEGYSRNVVNNIVNNTTNIGTAIHSPVQQAGAQSTQSQVATYSAESRADLARLVNEVSGHLHELKLDAAATTDSKMVDTVRGLMMPLRELKGGMGLIARSESTGRVHSRHSDFHFLHIVILRHVRQLNFS